ncbi:cobalamin-binding protein [Proteiniborus sp. MB09-C3]|uniref:cobalamin-binding protein n=1 Tax=Proteiniborus sp. MB09-C3 TaxID=3050072 RepID=UPI0025558283|nr:cobalamin-binding protein [Proteiniborus sp. MB09-C3]WIV12119.1 cobalamin-binding protein [Proteiniborus sp. MB09-C3]
MFAVDSDIFAFVKPSLDAHTLGVNSAAELLRDCGYRVIFGDEIIAKAINDIKYEANQKIILDWICKNKISRIGLSYRLDQDEAVKMMGYFMNALESSNLLSYRGGPIKSIFFGGLPKACEIIEKEHKGFVKTFKGGESVCESLMKMDVPDERIPKDILNGSLYDDFRLEFGKDTINAHNYDSFKPVERCMYKEYGTSDDTLVKRLNYNMKRSFIPLMRAHVGPYSSAVDRLDLLKEFMDWAKYLAKTKYLDILSIGSSQLTQSNFGEDWKDKPNGGGVPVNSPEEYRMIWEVSRPLLVRTYAGTKNIPELAEMYEKTLNTCWHALSLWWFNKLDERGPYDLYTNLKQHIETLKYITKTDKPFEANVSHHFAFRGADDVTYIVSAYLSAKLARKLGVKTFILQNMLNTPRFTWGIQDLAKSRAMLTLIKELENSNFKVLLQPRAGLDYFRPDLEEAKIQLAAVAALMDDIDPHNETSPPIIHVVSYSEASHLATPNIINESIKITQYSLQKYRELRRIGNVEDMSKNLDVQERMFELIDSAKTIISGIETHIDNPYTAEGFYKIFAAGFLPVPYLWGEVEEFKYAKYWKTKPVKGGVKIVDENNKLISSDKVVDYAKENIKEVEYILNQKNC